MLLIKYFNNNFLKILLFFNQHNSEIIDHSDFHTQILSLIVASKFLLHLVDRS